MRVFARNKQRKSRKAVAIGQGFAVVNPFGKILGLHRVMVDGQEEIRLCRRVRAGLQVFHLAILAHWFGGKAHRQ